MTPTSDDADVANPNYGMQPTRFARSLYRALGGITDHEPGLEVTDEKALVVDAIGIHRAQRELY